MPKHMGSGILEDALALESSWSSTISESNLECALLTRLESQNDVAALKQALCASDGIAVSDEQGVTKAINKMVDIAQKDKDHNTFTFLQFFVNEQIEEEQQFETVLQKFNLLGRDKLAIYEIDKILAAMAVSPTPAN